MPNSTKVNYDSYNIRPESYISSNVVLFVTNVSQNNGQIEKNGSARMGSIEICSLLTQRGRHTTTA